MTTKSTVLKGLGTITFAVSMSISGPSANAGSVAGFGGSTEITQILNNVELVGQSAQLATQIQQTLQQVLMEKQQLQNLIAAPSQYWGQAQQDLTALTDLVAKTNALTYAGGSIDQVFRQKYPGYASSAGSTNFGTQYTSMVNSQLASLSTAFQVAGLQSSQFATERSALQQIQGISAGSQGSLQAIQAGNMIASQTIDQLQKLRQLNMAQMQAQNTYLASQAQAHADQTDAMQLFLKQGDGTVRKPGQGQFKSF